MSDQIFLDNRDFYTPPALLPSLEKGVTVLDIVLAAYPSMAGLCLADALVFQSIFVHSAIFSALLLLLAKKVICTSRVFVGCPLTIFIFVPSLYSLICDVFCNQNCFMFS